MKALPQIKLLALTDKNKMRIISNLNGLLLCPYQILVDLCEQLPECPSAIKKIIFAPICELNSTNDWINLESLGNPGAVRAKNLVTQIQKYLDQKKITHLTFAIHCDDGNLTLDNLYSLIYLSAIYCLNLECYTENVSLFAEKISALAKHANIRINLKNSANLDTKQLHLLQQNRQHNLFRLGFKIEEQGLAEVDAHPEQLGPIIGYAWLCLKAGAYAPACKLLEAVLENSAINSPAYERLFMHLLMMRFFSHQYELIALGYFPAQWTHLNAQEVQTLYFFKAYAATLSRHLTIAQEFFSLAGIHAQMVIHNETGLYQLNLFALSRVLLGQIETAFDLEFRIKEYCELKNITTVGLRYVNLINIARLYRKTKNFEQALHYYGLAYAQIEGGYSTGDYIYWAINLAGVYEEQGDKKTALNYWIQAAIFWLAYDNKYALSWRPRLILCTEQINQINSPLDLDKAHLFLANKIQMLIEEVNPHILSFPTTPCTFTARNGSGTEDTLHISQNITLFSRDSSTSLGTTQTAGAMQLQSIVSQFLYATMAVDVAADILVESQHELHEINTEKQAYRVMALTRCNTCYFNGIWLDNSQLNLPVTIGLSSAIAHITPQDNISLVHYKRSFLNKALTEKAEVALLERLQFSNVEITPFNQEQLHLINILANKKIIELCD